jgi:hypothetical protein
MGVASIRRARRKLREDLGLLSREHHAAEAGLPAIDFEQPPVGSHRAGRRSSALGEDNHVRYCSRR